jgi:hypothetical protein
MRSNSGNDKKQSEHEQDNDQNGVYMVPVDINELIKQQTTESDNNIDLRPIIAWLWQKRLNLAKGFVIGAFLAIVVSFLITPVYKAEVTYLPVESGGSSRMAALMSQVGGLGGFAGIGDKQNFSDQLKVVLESRKLADSIFKRFPDLEPLLFPDYETDPPHPEVRNEELIERISVVVPRSGGANKFAIELPHATMSAQIANAYMEELEKWVNQNSLTTARESRHYLETQVDHYKQELIDKEEALKNFQQKHQLVSINIQTEETIKFIASLRAQLITKEMEKEVLLKTATTSNSRVRMLEDEITAIRERLKQLETGTEKILNRLNSPDPATAGIMSGGLASAPEKLLQYYRLRRDVEITQKVFELLMQQYELTRIQEQKESSTFTLIDAAYIPQKPVRPRKKLYAVAGAILGMLLSLGLVFFRERSKSPSAEQMNK